METFYSIQGEGYHQGKAAFFIRLAGCDVGCTWCDVKESWQADKHIRKTCKQIVEETNTFFKQSYKDLPENDLSRICIITGGEPCMYPLNKLTTALKKYDYRLHLETSGAYLITGNFDWVCISPKKFKPPIKENLQLANELKMIVFNHHDFLWAEEFAKQVPKNCALYLQPEWSRENKMLPFIIDYIKENPRWALSIQLHKYVHVP
ncbi:MAG: radical SAM protein [Bacteroidetes bacterium]|nr:radical SAM protein [Bacteroidota bacterium]